MFDSKTILITGGTGSFGKKYTETLLVDTSPKKSSFFPEMSLNNLKCNRNLITLVCAILSVMCVTVND